MIKFLAFTDLHYDYATQGDERIRQLVSRAKSEEVDFVVSLGDITAPFEQYSHVIEKVKSCGVPFYQVLGNHDVKVDLHQTMEFLGLEEPYYSFTHGEIKFLVLNSCYYRQGNEEHSFPEIKGEGVDTPIIPREELEWLKKELEDEKDYVIFSHHSFTNQFRNRAVRNRQDVFELFKGKNILLCMNGHDHGNDFKIIDQVPFYTMNSAYAPWIGFPNNDGALMKKYEYLHGYVPYDRALSAVVTIESDADRKHSGVIQIEGMNGDYESVTPAELGLAEPRWNGVSVEPKASSYVISFDGMKKEICS
ncbi:metallophosphoesterase family protein [Butyrivibrio sp. VCD2006]|uniref:metallophosphoesterase family protein n=1 Tax=Butyrivibrio sp. VCD2006 TaxID=1280664 RepID=UPI000400CB5E|nr:metallophosphoesterase [Butyrivibrio sp. VCD2006]